MSYSQFIVVLSLQNTMKCVTCKTQFNIASKFINFDLLMRAFCGKFYSASYFWSRITKV